jgi:GAF domain-containing protein
LQQLLLEADDVTDFLQQVVTLAAAVIPASACSVTMRRDRQLVTAASSHDLARAVDEIQYGRGQGPCLEAVHSGSRRSVPQLATDERWPDYRTHAIAQGVASSLSLPLMVEGSALGALNCYGTVVAQFDGSAAVRAELFAKQIVTALRIVIHRAQQTRLERQLREALASRAIIDQAIGMIAGRDNVTASAAFATLREASQRRNLKLTTICREIIETISGHPYEPPRPFTER